MDRDISMQKEKYVDATVPLVGVISEKYEKLLVILRSFGDQRKDFSSDEEYEKALIIIANNLYLIYERLYLNAIREIDYGDIKRFATSNNKFVKYIFKKEFKEFSIEAFDWWTQPLFRLDECAMYRRNTWYNKNIFH